jgi:hypothetical protein
MDRLLIALAIMAVAAIVAEVVRRRRQADPPTQPRRPLPSQLDRADFEGDGWLVAVFTSDTCSTCADVVRKADVMRCGEVSVSIVSFQARPDLHERYGIDAVPCLVVADADGVVHGGFLGPVTATDLWAAVADARAPGSIDRSGGCGDH